MTLLFTDDFNRTDSVDLGADWSTARTTTPRVFNLLSNAARPGDSNGDSSEVNDTVGVLTDCWAESTLQSPGSGGVGAGCGVALRNASPVTGGFNQYRIVGNASGYEVGKFVNNTFTSLGSGSGTTFATTDTLYAEIIGAQINCKKGSLLGVGGASFGSFASDSTFASGLSCVAYSSSDGASTGIDSWSVGNFSAAASDPQGSFMAKLNRPGRGPKNTGRYKIRTQIDVVELTPAAAPATMVEYVRDRVGTRDNRPGRGPYSVGRYYRPSIDVFPSGSQAYSLTCDPGSYALTGQSVGLPVARTMAAVQGAYALTGQAVALTRGRVLGAVQGSYALTGQSVALTRGRVLAAAQGAYALTGQTVGLARGRVLGAVQGSYALTGQAVALTRGRVLVAVQGAYALTGQAVALTRGRVLGAVQGSYALTGQAVTLTLSGSHAFTITAAQGAYALTGQSVGLPVGRKMAIAQGAYVISGKTVGLSIARLLPVAPGSYVLTGRAVGLSVGRKMTAAQGAYALGGQAAQLTVGHVNGRVIVCAPGAYVISGKPIVMTVRRRISLGLGLYALAGQAVELVFTASIFHGQLFHSRPEFLAMDRIVLQFFGETTQYFAGSGTPTQPRGVFFDPYTDVDVGTAEVQSVAPYVWYLLADLPADPQEIPPTAIIIRGKSYKPKEPQKDSDGGVKIELHLST